MSIYSNDNIRKIAKLTTRELPQKSKNAKITVRENNGLYSILCVIWISDLIMWLLFCLVNLVMWLDHMIFNRMCDLNFWFDHVIVILSGEFNHVTWLHDL